MWHTHLGDRHLQGREAEFWKHAVDCWFSEVADGSLKFEQAVKAIHENDEFQGGYIHNKYLTPHFRNMPVEQQVIAVAEVTRQLLDPEIVSPDLVAWNEATILAMCQVVSVELGVEIDYDFDAPADASEYNKKHNLWNRWCVNEYIGHKCELNDDPELNYDESDYYPKDEHCKDLEMWKQLISDHFRDYILWDDNFRSKMLICFGYYGLR